MKLTRHPANRTATNSREPQLFDVLIQTESVSIDDLTVVVAIEELHEQGPGQYAGSLELTISELLTLTGLALQKTELASFDSLEKLKRRVEQLERNLGTRGMSP